MGDQLQGSLVPSSTPSSPADCSWPSCEISISSPYCQLTLPPSHPAPFPASICPTLQCSLTEGGPSQHFLGLLILAVGVGGSLLLLVAKLQGHAGEGWKGG